jgi:hypothetical protein
MITNTQKLLSLTIIVLFFTATTARTELAPQEPEWPKDQIRPGWVPPPDIPVQHENEHKEFSDMRDSQKIQTGFNPKIVAAV